MKTYTFAPLHAPVQEHMRGLVKGLEIWTRDCQGQMDIAKTQKAKQYWRGKRDGFIQAIDAIRDSHSI